MALKEWQPRQNWKGHASIIAPVSALPVAGKTEQKDAQHNEGDQDIKLVALKSKRDRGKKYARHRSGDKKEQAELNYASTIERHGIADDSRYATKLRGLGLEDLFVRAGLANLTEVKDASREDNDRREDDAGAQQRA